MSDEKEPEEIVPTENLLSICVIEDDPTVSSSIMRCLSAHPDIQTKEFPDAETAWEELTKKTYKLVVLDWKLPGLSGAGLFNRLRQHPDYEFVPILVISGYLRKKDFSLLEELPFTGLLEKPFSAPFFIRKVRELQKTIVWFNGQRDKIADLTNSMKSADPKKALEEFSQLVDSAPQPASIAIAAARMLVRDNHFVEAEFILKKLLTLIPDCLMAMSELGKVYLRTKRFDEAKAILDKAQLQSPDNIERLNLLGDASLNLLDTDTAKIHFNAALNIDPDDKQANAGIMLSENVDTYLTRFNVTSIPQNFASLLNAIGITMVKGEKIDKGIEHYESAMRYVSDSESRAKLAFNLGLGYLKWQNNEKALSWFSRAVQLSEGKFEKALKNANRVRDQLEKKGVVYFEDDIELLDDPVSVSATPVPDHHEIAKDNTLELKLTALPTPAASEAANISVPVEAKKDNPKENSNTGKIISAPAQKPAESVTLGSTEPSKVLPQNFDGFIELDEVKKFLIMAARTGEHRDVSRKKLNKFFDDYGTETLLKVMLEAAKSDAPNAGAIAFMIQKYRKVS